MPYHIKITEGSTVKYFTGKGTSGIVTSNYDIDFSSDYSERMQFSSDMSSEPLMIMYNNVGVAATCILE